MLTLPEIEDDDNIWIPQPPKLGNSKSMKCRTLEWVAAKIALKMHSKSGKGEWPSLTRIRMQYGMEYMGEGTAHRGLSMAKAYVFAKVYHSETGSLPDAQYVAVTIEIQAKEASKALKEIERQMAG